MIRLILKKFRDSYVIIEYLQSIEQHYVTVVMQLVRNNYSCVANRNRCSPMLVITIDNSWCTSVLC